MYQESSFATNHCSNLFGTFFFPFCFKSKHSAFFLQDGISIIAIAMKIACQPRTKAHHTRKQATHTTHATHASTPPTLARLPRHPY